MSAFRSQERLNGPITPIIVNVMNFAKAPDGEATLLSFDDARTLFHEFGHALHGLLSDVTYPLLSGTAVSRDFVELPSQLYEHWLEQPEVLRAHARHHRTGEPMPDALLRKLLAARTFNQGFATVEYTASAIVDMTLHLSAEGEGGLDVPAFEAEALRRISMPAEISMRHRTPHFAHIFSGTATPPDTTATSGRKCWTRTPSTRSARPATSSIRRRRSGCVPSCTGPATCAIRARPTRPSAGGCRASSRC